MVGLSVILEGKKGVSILSKTTMSSTATIDKPCPVTSPASRNQPPAPFLDQCFLCRQKLLPGKDIYVYKGDRGFCSKECRFRQIYMDEQESSKRKNCSMAAMKPASSSASRGFL